MARRTFSDYKATVVHALGAAPAIGTSADEIVNDALVHLAAMHPWRWRRGGPFFLDLIKDKNFVVLPSDFGEEVSITRIGSFTVQMLRTTIEQIERLRQSIITNSAIFGIYYAVNTGQTDAEFKVRNGQVPSGPTLGLSVPVLEIYPTPSSDSLAGMSLIYLRDVPKLVLDLDVPAIPIWMDHAFALLCRSFAHTVEDDNPNSGASQKFDALLPSLKQRDGLGQGRLGVMSGGLHQSSGHTGDFLPSFVLPPTSV